jgi:hypothetical protein
VDELQYSVRIRKFKILKNKSGQSSWLDSGEGRKGNQETELTQGLGAVGRWKLHCDVVWRAKNIYQVLDGGGMRSVVLEAKECYSVLYIYGTQGPTGIDLACSHLGELSWLPLGK